MTTRTRLYEALIRVNANSQGDLTFDASERDIVEFLDADGKVLPGQAFPQDPRAITAPALLGLIGEQLPAAVAEKDAAVAAKAQADADHAAAVEALNSAHAGEIASLAEAHATALAEAASAREAAEGAAATLTGEKAALEAQLAQANADKAALQAQIDELTAEPERQAVLRYRFDAALELLPSLTGAEGRTLGEDFDAFKDGLPRAIQKRLNAPEYYRDDEQLNQLATVMVATFQPDNADPGATAQALLDQAFALAPTIP